MTPEEQARGVAWGLIDEPASDGKNPVAELFDREKAERFIAAAIREAVTVERERCARVAEVTTAAMTGFAEPNRVEFAVMNMAKIRSEIARRIREGS